MALSPPYPLEKTSRHPPPFGKGKGRLEHSRVVKGFVARSTGVLGRGYWPPSYGGGFAAPFSKKERRRHRFPIPLPKKMPTEAARWGKEKKAKRHPSWLLLKKRLLIPLLKKKKKGGGK